MHPQPYGGEPPLQNKPGPSTRTVARTKVGRGLAFSFLAVIGIITNACSVDEDVAEVSQSLVDENVCLLSDVTWVDPESRTIACTGPWTYQVKDTETSRDPICGVERCIQRSRCDAWIAQPPVPYGTRTWRELMQCTWVGNGRVCAPRPGAGSCAEFDRLQREAWTVPPNSRLVRSRAYVDQREWPGPGGNQIEYTCRVFIEYDTAVAARYDTCSCETEEHRSCLHAISTTHRIVTAAGLTEAQVRNSYHAAGAGQWTAEEISPACTTAEDVPNGQPVTKLERLLGSYADAEIAPVGSPLRDEIVRRIKASYELLGHGIPAQGDLHRRVLAIYEQHPDVSPDCGREVEAETPVCDAETDWRLKLCTRLTSGHVDAGLATLRYDDCLQELAALGDAIDGGRCANQHPYVEASVDVHRRLMESMLIRFAERLAASPRVGDVPTYDTAVIGAMLHRIDRWFFRVGRVVRDEQRTYRELALTTNKFWQAAHGYMLADGAAAEWHDGSIYDDLQNRLSEAQEMEDETQARLAVEQALGLTELRGLALDRAVLSAAYSSTGTPSRPVLTSAPLLRITHDALAPLVERLDGLVQFHDVGCALANCAAFSTPTKLSRYWKALSRLASTSAHPPSLGDVLRDPRWGNLHGWTSVFATIRDNQQRLVDAVEESRRSGANRDRELVELIDAAKTRISAYEATGLFLPAVGNELHTGVHAAQRERVKEHVRGLRVEVMRRRGELESRLVALVNALVQVRDRDSSRVQLESAEQTLFAELQVLGTRAKSLARLAATGVDAGVSEFETLMAEWSQISDAVDENAYLRVGSTEQFQPSGTAATFTGWREQDVDDVDIGAVLNVSAGQVVSIAASGAWAPTCSLRATKIISPDKAIELLDDPGLDGNRLNDTSIPVGPEGYSITWTGSGFTAASNNASVSARITTGLRHEACMKSPVPYAELKGCAYIDTSISAEAGRSWQGGTEGRTSASFASGLFVPGTPFEAPTGALLVVELPRGQVDEGAIRNVHYVRGPHTTIVVAQDADLYLVANDQHCDVQDDANKLTVTVGRFTTVGAAADALVRRMARTKQIIRQKLNDVIERGELLPAEATALELQAKLAQIGEPGSLQVPVDEYPAPLRDLFFKHIAQEMARLQASVRLAATEREIAIRSREYRAALLAAHNARMSGYLVSLLPKWSVRGMQLEQVREAAAQYAKDTRYYLRPVLKLWYPQVLARVAQLGEVSQLVSIDADTPMVAMTTMLDNLGTEIEDLVEDADVLYPSPEDTAPVFVTLRHPKPSLLDPACAHQPSARCRRRLDLATFQWATVGSTKRLWASLGTPGDGNTVRRLEFRIDPEDLYQRVSGSEYLPCTKVLPVVRKIGLALTGYPANGIPSERRSIEGTIPDNAPMSFIDATGSHVFSMANPTWRNLAVVPLIYTNTNYARVKTEFAAIPQDVRGVSPFTTFVFEIPESTVAEWRIRDAQTIDLILEVEAVRGNESVALPKCSTATTPPPTTTPPIGTVPTTPIPNPLPNPGPSPQPHPSPEPVPQPEPPVEA